VSNTTELRIEAAKYARAFIVSKYKEEYNALYRAYLINRGVSVRNNLVDERVILHERTTMA
jgi:hypothetical protein